MASDPQDRTWSVREPSALLWEHWDEESILFDRRSGQTHLLTASTVQLLSLLEQAPLPASRLIEALSPPVENGSPLMNGEQVDALLHTLAELGLVESSPA